MCVGHMSIGHMFLEHLSLSHMSLGYAVRDMSVGYARLFGMHETTRGMH